MTAIEVTFTYRQAATCTNECSCPVPAKIVAKGSAAVQKYLNDHQADWEEHEVYHDYGEQLTGALEPNLNGRKIV